MGFGMGHYDVLGVGMGADGEAVRSAYKRLALKHHPDKNPGDAGAEARFVAVSEAFRVLSDASRRAAYDREVSGERARRASAPPTAQAGPPAPGAGAGGPWGGPFPGASDAARRNPPPRKPREAGDMRYEGHFRTDVPGFNRGRPGVPRPREARGAGGGRAAPPRAGTAGAAAGSGSAGNEGGAEPREDAKVPPRKPKVPNTSGWSHRRSFPEAYSEEDARQAALRAAMARAEKAARMAKDAARRRAESVYGPAFGRDGEGEEGGRREEARAAAETAAQARAYGAGGGLGRRVPDEAFVRERAAEMHEDTEAFLERLRRSKEQWDEEMRRERENLVMRQREAWDGMERGAGEVEHGRRGSGFVAGGRGRAAMERERAAAAAAAAARQDAASAAAAMGPAAAAAGGGAGVGPGGMMRLSNVLRDMVNGLPEGLRRGTSFRTRVQRRLAGDPTGVTSQAKIASVWVSRDGRFLHWRFADTKGHAPDGGMDVPRVQRVRLLRPREQAGSDAGVTGRSNRLAIECEGEDVGMRGVRPVVTLLLEHSREDDGCAVVETWASAFGEYAREAKRLILLAS